MFFPEGQERVSEAVERVCEVVAGRERTLAEVEILQARISELTREMEMRQETAVGSGECLGYRQYFSVCVCLCLHVCVRVCMCIYTWITALHRNPMISQTWLESAVCA